MKVKELKEILDRYDPETEVVMEWDEHGWYNIGSLFPFKDEDGKIALSIDKEE